MTRFIALTKKKNILNICKTTKMIIYIILKITQHNAIYKNNASYAHTFKLYGF